MAFIRPSFVATLTTTPGTITYTLSSADPGGGYRTLADAVADGDAANGDTISYFVVDTTTSGSGLTWEHGIGTIGSAGLTLARTTIIESSNSDAAVSWPSGGSRTVRFGAGTSGFAQLAATQTFTGANTFSGATTVTGSFNVSHGASSGTIDATSTLTTGAVAKVRFFGNDSGGANQLYGELRVNAVDATATSEDGSFVMSLMRAGTLTNVFTFGNDGTITEAVGARTFAYQGTLDAPSGMRLLSLWTTVPTGWSVVGSTNDKTILTTETPAEASTTGGSWTISGLVTSIGATALTEAQLAAHDHPVKFDSVEVQAGTGETVSFLTELGVSSITSEDAGSGSTHTHTATTTAGSSYRPAWIKALVIVKS